MKRVRTENINTPEYWNEAYRKEAETAKHRVDLERVTLVGRWCQQRYRELGRRVAFLDVGCGPAEVGYVYRDTEWLAYTGIDISDTAIELAREKIPGAELHVGDIRALALSWGAYDYIWVGETLEHFEQPLSALARLYELAGDGAMLALSTPYRGRNRSDEHNWEFEPADIISWAQTMGELVFLDVSVCNYQSMFGVIRVAKGGTPS